jgi:hypothetical protein
MPDARCTRGLVRKMVERNAHEHTGSAEAIRHSLRDGLRLIARSPRCPGFDSHRRPRIKNSENLTSASGGQDHTPSLVRARLAFVSRKAPRPPHPASYVRDDRDTPLLWRRDERRQP